MDPRYDIPLGHLASAFDGMFQAGDIFSIGNLEAKVLGLPGHTPDLIGYLIGSNVFACDFIFNPDLDSARADFPGASATELWAPMRKLLDLPSHFRLYAGNDHPTADPDAAAGKREPRSFATVEEHKVSDKHAKIGVIEDEFVNMRTESDVTLWSPRLMHQSLEVSIAGGRFPKSKDGTVSLMSAPIEFSEISCLLGSCSNRAVQSV